MTVLWTLFLAAVLEEVLFRGGLQEFIWRVWPTFLMRGVSWANVMASGVFAVLHGLHRSWPLALCAVVAGLLLGWVYERRRQLLPCVALHAGMNLAWWMVRPLSSWAWLGS